MTIAHWFDAQPPGGELPGMSVGERLAAAQAGAAEAWGEVDRLRAALGRIELLTESDIGEAPNIAFEALGDDGVGEHCSCCAHRRGIGVDPCGGPRCPCRVGGPRRRS